MNINIKVSEIMSKNTGRYGDEDKILRVPKVTREKLGLTVGQDFILKSVHEQPVVLTVCPAYQTDVDLDESYCYVSNSVFVLVNIDNTLKIEPVKTITLGCDPEFFLVDKQSNHLLRANAFFKKWGEIGHDGILAELRPRPALTPQALTDNIYELITQTRQILDLVRNYDTSNIVLHGASSYRTGFEQQLIAGVNPYATAGFHLHFGLPNKILGTSPEVMSLMFRVARVLDYFVGIPAVIIEREDDKRRTNNNVGYGKPSDFRLDHRTFEYRVPGGSMLRHPILTKGLIALGSVVMTDLISRLKNVTQDFKNLNSDFIDENINQFYRNLPDLDSLFAIICSPDLTRAEKLVDNIHGNLVKMIGFRDEQSSIEALFECIKHNVRFNNNIEDNWRNFYEPQADIRGPSDASHVNSTGSCLLEKKSF